MKKILLATTLLASTATVAMADTGVSVSGYGRFGLTYLDTRAVETQVASRLRFNIDGKTETDSGVTFGGRIRIQHTNGQTAASTNAAMLYASYEGFRVEVGNVNTAFDSAGLIYAPEMGYLDSSYGDPQGSFFAYAPGPTPANYTGVFASYSMGDFTGRISYVNPDQTVSGSTEELSVSFDYASGPFAVSLAAYQDGAGIANNDGFFLGAAYTINDAATVGLNYIDEDSAGGRVVTLYGNYTMGATTLRGYIADLDVAGADTAYGLGADYDLGGARLSGSIQSGYAGQTWADVGVRFDF